MRKAEDLELFHYGVKGMKWGIRRSDKELGKGRSSSKSDTPSKKSGPSKEELTARFKAADKPKKLSKAEQAANLAENKRKFANKAGFDESDITSGDSGKGWRPTKKQVATVAVGAAAVGLVLYGGYKLNKYYDHEPLSPISAEKFKTLTLSSQMGIWGSENYLTPSAYEQKEFTLPAGHTFHRISKFAETEFFDATYATSSTDDFRRYVAGFRGELGDKPLKHITFSAKEDIRVPDLTTRLQVFREAYNEVLGKNLSDDQTVAFYKNSVGGKWDAPVDKAFMSKLKDLGFSAIIDDMDAGVIGDAPLVLIDPEKFTNKVSEDLTDEAIKFAEENLKELANRKRL